MSEQTRNARSNLSLWLGSLVVWLLLMLLLGLTLWLAYVPLGDWNHTVSIVIGAAKALLVVLIYMRLRKSPAICALAAVAGLVWLSALYSLTFTDFPFRQAGERIEVPVGFRQSPPRPFASTSAMP